MAEQPLRLTRQRQAVADVLSTLDDFRSAQEIHELLTGRATPWDWRRSTARCSCSPTTTRSTSCAVGTARRATAAAPASHHHHLVCRGCGATVEVEGPAVEQWTRSVAEQHGYAEVSHTLEIFGNCPPLSLSGERVGAASATGAARLRA